MAAAAPGLEYVARIVVEVGTPIDLGRAPRGHSRIVPITGGSFVGPGLRGRVVPGGADNQLLVTDTLTELDAQYALETDDGAMIGVRNVGLRAGSPADIAALVAGRAVAPDRIRFHTMPRFTTADPGLGWLNDRLFVARGVRRPTAVELEVFSVT